MNVASFLSSFRFRALLFGGCVELALFLASAAFASDTLSPTAQRLRDRVRYLASGELRGRAPGTAGNEKALESIVEAFKKNNLQMLDTSYFQRFPVLTSVKLGKVNSAFVRIQPTQAASSKDSVAFVLKPVLDPTDSVASARGKREEGKREENAPEQGITALTANAKKNVRKQAVKLAASVPQQKNIKLISWKLGVDFTPLAFSEDNTVAASLVFVGYGISAKENNYDDYDGVDTKGKIVVALRGTLDAQNPHSPYQRFASLRSKALNAREHGAAAIVFVNSTAETVSSDGADDLPALKLDRTGNSGILAVQASRKAVGALLPEGATLTALEERIIKSKQPASLALTAAAMTLAAELDHSERLAANVIGLVRGTDTTLAGEYIVVGAHCDHLGMGEENSLYAGKEAKIHYGADDNASGTAGMLELAAAVAQKPLRRSVLFMAFNAEESGLLGSQWYCKYPRLPLEKCAFMLNMDMIGRMKGNALSVHGTGTSSRWEPLVDSLAKRHSLTVSKSADGFGPSDHASFYAKNLPVLFLFTGLHDDYHRPSDTWDKINYAGQEAVVRFAEDIVRSADVLPRKPDFIKVQANQVQRSTGFRVYVGTIPDYNDHPKGMRITGVREGSPAQKAGLQEGDVIVAIGGSTIKNVYDYTYALGSYKPGDRTKIVVLRGSRAGERAGEQEQQITTELTFEVRK